MYFYLSKIFSQYFDFYLSKNWGVTFYFHLSKKIEYFAECAQVMSVQQTWLNFFSGLVCHFPSQEWKLTWQGICVKW